MTDFTFLVPKAIVLTQNQRLHYMQKGQYTKTLRAMGRAAAEVVDPVTTPCAMTVLVGWPDSRRRDVINVSPTVKALVDGLVDAGLIPDDDSRHIAAETYRSWVAREKGFTRFDITLTPLEAE